jgi:hypothetical protein
VLTAFWASMANANRASADLTLTDGALFDRR